MSHLLLSVADMGKPLNKPTIFKPQMAFAMLLIGCFMISNGPRVWSQDATSAPKDFVIKGRCLKYSADVVYEGPAVNTKVTLFARRGLSMEMEQLQQTRTDDEGMFEIRRYVLTFEAEGYALTYEQINGNRSLFMLEKHDATMYLGGAVLSGRIVNEDGDNVSGATVEQCDHLPAAAIGRPVITTKSNGLFRLKDLPQTTGGQRGITDVGLLIRHPEYPIHIARVAAEDFQKGAVRIVLPSGTKVTGKVLNADTKSPVANTTVNAIGSEYIDMFFFAKTDENGNYELNLPDGRFQLQLEDESLVAKAQVVECFKGEVLKAKPILAEPGGWIVGQVTDKLTGKPVSREYPSENKPDWMVVGCHGPARPVSDGGLRFVSLAKVDDDGHYRMRVYPGENFPYLSQAKTDRRINRTLDLPPVIVTAGEETVYDFSVEPFK